MSLRPPWNVRRERTHCTLAFASQFPPELRPRGLLSDAGAPDATLTISGYLSATNAFPPASFGDAFGFEGGNGTFEGREVFFGGWTASLDQAFFPGTGAPHVPLLEPGDVNLLRAGVFESSNPARFPAYELTNATVTVVPEPAPGLAVALGLVVLGIVGRRAERVRRSLCGLRGATSDAAQGRSNGSPV